MTVKTIAIRLIAVAVVMGAAFMGNIPATRPVNDTIDHHDEMHDLYTSERSRRYYAEKANRAGRAHVAALIRSASRAHGLNATKMLKIAECESNLNPKARSRSGRFRGVYQMDAKYWKTRAKRAGVPGASVYDAYANIQVAAWLANVSGLHHWPRCRYAR